MEVGSREIELPELALGFPSTIRAGMDSSSSNFEGWFGEVLPECTGRPSILRQNRIMPARIAGMQAQRTAVHVSNVDQKVVEILSHVGSAVSPNVLRL